MPDSTENFKEIKARMTLLGVSQLSIVNEFIATGKCTEENRNSLGTQLNFALNGKRTTKRYTDLLRDVSEILSKVENASNL